MTSFQRGLIQATTFAMLTIASVYAADQATFTSGGVGESEEIAIKSTRSQYNVHLLLTEKSGAYLSGTHITITDRNGNTVIDTVSQGPYFYATLPNGQYTLVASSDELNQQRKLTVRHGRATDLHIAF